MTYITSFISLFCHIHTLIEINGPLFPWKQAYTRKKVSIHCSCVTLNHNKRQRSELIACIMQRHCNKAILFFSSITKLKNEQPVRSTAEHENSANLFLFFRKKKEKKLASHWRFRLFRIAVLCVICCAKGRITFSPHLQVLLNETENKMFTYSP